LPLKGPTEANGLVKPQYPGSLCQRCQPYQINDLFINAEARG
jgi:hypothetical protein